MEKHIKTSKYMAKSFKEINTKMQQNLPTSQLQQQVVSHLGYQLSK
jgi:hypothetical protein